MIVDVQERERRGLLSFAPLCSLLLLIDICEHHTRDPSEIYQTALWTSITSHIHVIKNQIGRVFVSCSPLERLVIEQLSTVRERELYYITITMPAHPHMWAISLFVCLFICLSFFFEETVHANWDVNTVYWITSTAREKQMTHTYKTNLW